jgi:hypothetical protein
MDNMYYEISHMYKIIVKVNECFHSNLYYINESGIFVLKDCEYGTVCVGEASFRCGYNHNENCVVYTNSEYCVFNES